MKNTILTLGMVLMIITTSKAQHFEVKFNPIGALFGTIPVSAELVINESIGLEGTIGYYFKKDNTFNDASESKGFVTNGLVKFYFNPEDGGDKFYAFPYIRYADRSVVFREGNSDITATYTAFGAGFGIGYKWVSEKGVLLDIGFGLGRNFSGGYTYDDPNYSSSDDDVFPINGMGRISLGYRF